MRSPLPLFLLLVVNCSAQLSQRFYVPLDPGTEPLAGSNYTATDSLGNSYILTSVGDVRVTKLDPKGGIGYTKQFGGSGVDTGYAITADAAGDVWVTGTTRSADFPVTFPTLAPQDPNLTYTYIPTFVVKLDPSGNIIFSVIVAPTFLQATAIAVDQTGAVYLTGSVENGIPFTTPGAFEANPPGQNAFVLKLSPAGDRIVWATALGGSTPVCVANNDCPVPIIPDFFGAPIETEAGNAIAVDAPGNVYVGGVTNDVDFPVTPDAFQATCNCDVLGTNGFLSELSADGTHVLYSTYLGGISGVSVQALAINAAGEAWVAGRSPASFPTTSGSAWPAPPANSTDAPGFLAKVRADGSGLQFATYLMGSGLVTLVRGLALNADGSVTVAALNSRTGGVALGFDSTAAHVLFNAKLASAQADAGFAALPANGFVVAGSSGVVTGFQPNANPAPSVYALTDSATTTTRAHFAPGELVTFYGANLGPATGVASTWPNGFVPTQLAGTQILFDGFPAPLLYVSAEQVNAVVPYEVFERDQVTVQVVASGSSSSYTYEVVPADPMIFETMPGTTLVFNQDGTQNSSSNPAAAGSIATILATGAGMLVNPGGVTGQITTELSQTELPVSIVFQLANNQTVDAQITYAGPVPTLVSGMFQVNFVVSGSLFTLEIGGAVSQSGFVYRR